MRTGHSSPSCPDSACSPPPSPSPSQRLLAGLRHAFALDPAGPDSYSPEDRALIERLADAIVRRGMSAPAILFLESVLPLNYVASQALTFLQPFLSVCFNPADCERVARLLERRRTLELLVNAIENRSPATETRTR